MAKDIYGNDLAIGDTVTYFQTGRYSNILHGTIVDIKKTIKIGDITSLGRPGDRVPDTTWVSGSSCTLTTFTPPVAKA